MNKKEQEKMKLCCKTYYGKGDYEAKFCVQDIKEARNAGEKNMLMKVMILVQMASTSKPYEYTETTQAIQNYRQELWEHLTELMKEVERKLKEQDVK
jgi:hypothetical protein